jgi:hypothetical protein
MRIRSLVVSVLAFGLLLSSSVTALAAAPPTTPAVLQNITFETTAPTDTLGLDNSYNPGDASPTAPQWGRITGSHLGGSYGLWCAGTGSTFPTYASGTHGVAYLAVFDASQWAESQIRFSYIEPSVGYLDTPPNPFRVSWGDGSKNATASTSPTGYADPFLPLTTTWRTVTLDRGVGANPPMAGGWLRFQYLSTPNGGSPIGGATIDDIVVTGYEFGVVNNLVATRKHAQLSSVDISWDAPYARGTTTPDARDIWYRVWRHDMNANTWTEVTGARIHTTSFTDTGVPVGGTYQYSVQAWESSATTSWGKSASSASVGPAVIRFSGVSVAPSAVSYGGGSTLSAVLLDEIGAPIDGAQGSIVVQRAIGSGAWATIPGVVSEIATGTYSALVTSKFTSNYRLFYQVAGVASGSARVSSTAYVTVPGSPSRVTHNKNFTVTGKVSGVPGHARSVTLKAYRKESKKVAGKKTTVWVVRASAVVKIPASSGIVSYKKAFKVKTAGSYRLAATVSDAYSTSTVSAYRTFAAK